MAPSRKRISDRIKADWRWASLVAFIGLLLLVRALELRMPGLGRPIWEDEIHHNYPVLAANNLWHLLKEIQGQFQPGLDYILRRVFWFQLLGHQELALRLPALFWGCLNVLAAFGISTAFFRRQGHGKGTSIALGLLPALWVCNHATEIYYSAEARHYSFVSFASLLWCSVVFLLQKESWRLRWSGSLLLTNAHFFSLPLVGAKYGFSFFQSLRARQNREAFRSVLELGSLLVLTVALNVFAFAALFGKPPGAVASQAAGSMYEIVGQTWHLWLRFVEYLRIPLFPFWVWLVLAVFFAKGFLRKNALLLSGLATLVLAVVLAYIRSRSGYGFYDRYYTSFFGLGFVALVLGIDALVSRLWRPSFVLRAAWILVCFWAFQVPGFLKAAVAERAAITLPSKNFSSFYHTHRELKETRLPLFFLHSYCWSNDISLFYLTQVGDEAPYHYGYEVRDSKGCEHTAETIRGSLERFIRDNPRGIVVLDQKEESCVGREVPKMKAPLSVSRVFSTDRCVWKVEGAASVAQVAQIARAVGFEFNSDLLM